MIDAQERALLATTVREALTHTADADATLAELGWLDMLATEPDDAIAIVFDALGATNGCATALDDVLAGSLGARAHDTTAVLLPPFGGWSSTIGADGRVSGLATARVARAANVLVVTGAVGDRRVAMVDGDAVTVEPTAGIDPDAGFCRARVDLAGGVGESVGDAMWANAVSLGQRAVAQQIAGACRAMLALARTHALERVQFDRPIARFQAVRHRLADTLVAVEALDAALTVAAVAPGPETAAVAKVIAGRTARVAATHCQQVLAGIGFTTDHPFHRFFKRTVVLDGLLGSADELVVAIGRGLLERGRVPTLVEL